MNNSQIIKFIVTNRTIFKDYVFRFWKYVIAMIYIQHAKLQALICFDIKCIIILISKVFLKKQNTNYVLFKTFLISVHNVRQANSFIKMTIFHFNFQAWFNEKFVITKMKIKTYIIKNLKINLLLEIDNLISQEVIIDLTKQ